MLYVNYKIVYKIYKSTNYVVDQIALDCKWPQQMMMSGCDKYIDKYVL